MRLVETVDLVSAGGVSKSALWLAAWADVKVAIARTDWPHGSGQFTIRPKKHANGVKPIKIPCLLKLEQLGWKTEDIPRIEPGVLETGDLDAILTGKLGVIGFEWETGNISSSHRAINKLMLAMLRKSIVGGFLVIPSMSLYPLLTDRVGNIKELRPYFDLWKAIDVHQGCLRIVVVQHDRTSSKVKTIPKGTDGRAMR